jgi:hypothetical protein
VWDVLSRDVSTFRTYRSGTLNCKYLLCFARVYYVAASYRHCTAYLGQKEKYYIQVATSDLHEKQETIGFWALYGIKEKLKQKSVGIAHLNKKRDSKKIWSSNKILPLVFRSQIFQDLIIQVYLLKYILQHFTKSSHF